MCSSGQESNSNHGRRAFMFQSYLDNLIFLTSGVDKRPNKNDKACVCKKCVKVARVMAYYGDGGWLMVAVFAWETIWPSG